MYFVDLLEDTIPPTAAGIGTAAGVAWPIFGILFGTLGLIAGGMTAIVLGSVCISLFTFVALPVTYWTYQAYHKERAKLALARQEQEANLYDFFSKYLFDLLKNYSLFGDLQLKNVNSMIIREHLKAKLLEDLCNPRLNLSPALKDFFFTLLNNTEAKDFLFAFAEAYKDKTHYSNIDIKDYPCLSKQLNNLFVINHMTHKKPSYAPQIKAGIGGFFAAFGSIAGCAAGTYGMLVGIGVFAGLSAVPLVGWIALAAALVFGLTVAGLCAYSIYKKNKQTQLIANYNQINHEIEIINLTKKTIAVENKLQQNINNNTLQPANDSKKPTQTKSEGDLPSVRKYSLCNSWNNSPKKSRQSAHIHSVPTFKVR